MSQKNIEAIYPLSPSQQGMFFESFSSSEAGMHIEQAMWSLHGNVNISVFEQVWQHILERHEILRAGFVLKKQKEPLMVVLKNVNVPFEFQDWQSLAPSQQQTRLDEYLKTDRLHSFNLSKAPLMRLKLFQKDKNSYQFVWTVHHILMDGWSTFIILKEVVSLYEKFSKNQPVSIAPISPYRAYVRWLKQQDLSQAEMFWQNTLQGVTRPSPLGRETESFRTGLQEQYDERYVMFPALTSKALESFVRQHHLTLSIFFQGIWALLLSRYSGASDVVFGITVSGRPPELAGAEEMIGLFINTIPIRIQVPPHTLCWPWLQQIQAQNVKQQAYAYCSSGQIHRWSEVPGSLPLYESILVFENYPLELSDLQCADVTVDVHSTQFIGAQTHYALTLMVIPGDELRLQIVYNTSRCDAAGITHILEHLRVVSEYIVNAQNQPLAKIMEQIPAEQIPEIVPFQSQTQQDLEKSFVPPRNPTEEALAAIWSNVLGLKQISVESNFFDLGGYSLLIAQLLDRIHEAFSVELPLRSLFEFPTIEGIARVVEIIRQGGDPFAVDESQTPDLKAEVVLEPDIHPVYVPATFLTEPNTVFLTGVTGFLGAYLLDELLQKTQAEIYCLIRASSVDEGQKRIRSNLESYEIWENRFSSRIIPVIGDLSKPLLGMRAEQFDDLAGRLDVIYHNGAWVNFVYPYSILKAANVLGTQEILRLAVSTKTKPVHFVSTLSVFSSPAYAHVARLLETDPVDHAPLDADGYVQSKWVAEKLVMKAASRGLAVSVYRAGTITGHSQTGASNTNDWFCRLIKGCIQLGAAPELDMQIPMTPVDYVSRAIVYLSRQKESAGKIFHPVAPHPVAWNDLINWIQSFGYALQLMSFAQWQEKLRQVSTARDNALAPFLPVFSGLEQISQEGAGGQQADCRNTLAGLAESSITCPAVNAALLHTYFSYFVRSGFLDPHTEH